MNDEFKKSDNCQSQVNYFEKFLQCCLDGSGYYLNFDDIKARLNYDDGLIYALLHYLTDANVIEYGTTIRYSWLTEEIKPDELRSFLERRLG